MAHMQNAPHIPSSDTWMSAACTGQSCIPAIQAAEAPLMGVCMSSGNVLGCLTHKYPDPDIGVKW